jgi:hypothetical protein
MDADLILSITKFMGLIPKLIIFAIGIIISVRYGSRNPKKYLLMTVSFSLLFFITLSGRVFSEWAILQYQETQYSTTIYLNRILIFGVIEMLIWLSAWIILFVAIFNPKNNLLKDNLSE